jgi:hypothetical protein
MSFELIMLICLGIQWPFIIIKTLKTKTVKGISPVFYITVFLGYIAGIIHKILNNPDYIISGYIISGILVLIQIILYFYYRNKDYSNSPPDWV